METTLIKQKPQFIRYGLSLDYVPKWGIQQALREIYQNYIDFGKFKDEIQFRPNGYVKVTVKNDWNPQDFSFLLVGGSKKNETQIGKYGEGLKLAFLVFLREGIEATMRWSNYEAKANKSHSELLNSDTYSIKISTLSESIKGFITEFTIPIAEWSAFKEKILDKNKVIFSCDYGDIINYEKGTVFVGGIYVCHLNGFGKAYNYRPQFVPLDRDREVPSSWDTERVASYIQQAQGILTAKDMGNDDSRYIHNIPKSVKDEVKPVLVEDEVQFVDKESGDVMPKAVKEKLIQDGEFNEEIKELKEGIQKDDSQMILDFKQKWIKGNREMEMDFDLLITKLNKLQS